MLTRLTVENYALIEKLELSLSPSLNIITGETGAGKSILLGALGMLMGNRCDTSVLKNPDNNCIVEGIFDIKGYALEDLFEDHNLDYDDNTIIRRVISPTGKSRAYVNDLPVQITTLKELGGHLIDIHSQHQTMLLGEDSFRIDILDTIAAHNELTDSYSKTYHDMRLAERELGKLKEDAEKLKQDEGWVRFQADELIKANLEEGEQEELENRLNELSHSEEIRVALSGALHELGGDEQGILVRLKSILNSISRTSGYYARSDEFTERLQSSVLELKDVEMELSSEAGRIDSDPAALAAAEERLGTIYGLQQKHRVSSVEELIKLRESFEKRLSVISGGDETITALEIKIASLRETAYGLAGRITQGRLKAGKELSAYVEKTLENLGIPETVFKVDITPAGELKNTGHDTIKFMFSANKNIEPAPVEKTASGGELSRLMLAIKSLAAKRKELPTIIFDEIDTGVSGRIADAMGNIIGELGHSMQVVNITHLPQIASKGETHFLVYKSDASGTSHTSIRELSKEERIEEIAKMLSGRATTEAAYTQAKLLLGL